MTLVAILIEVLTTYLEIETITQLANIVANHHAYHGKSRGVALERQILRIIKTEEFKQQLHQSDKYIAFKIGRFSLKFDLS